MLMGNAILGSFINEGSMSIESNLREDISYAGSLLV